MAHSETTAWLLDVPAQVAFENGTEIEPTVRQWDFIGFDISYNPLSHKIEIRGGGASSDWKSSVRVATTAPLPPNNRTANTLTAVANGALPAVDGISVIAGERILVKDEGLGENNGVYDIIDPGSAGTPFVLTRSILVNESPEVSSGLRCYVSEGTTNSQNFATCITIDPITLNSTPLVFALDSQTIGGVEELVTADLAASPFAVPNSAEIVGVLTSTGAIQIDLPNVALVPIGKRLTISDHDNNAGANPITVQAFGAQLIDGANTFPIGVNFGALTIYSTGTFWKIR